MRVKLLLAASAALFALAVYARGVRPVSWQVPVDKEKPSIALSMQLVGPSANLRLGELDGVVASAHRQEWIDVSRPVFALEGCPDLATWIQGAQGQRTERLLATLKRGEPEDALAALTLVFQIARSTKWTTGLFRNSEGAERLGAMLADWLDAWADRAMHESVLRDPARAAFVLWGCAMRAAYEAPAIGRNDAAYQRARAAVDRLTGASGPQLTSFGEALHATYPRAFATLTDSDFLRGCEDEAKTALPGVDGECSK